MEQDTGVDLHFSSKNKGADAVEPASGGSPPDCRIGVGSTPSSARAKQKHHPVGWCFRLEQDTGVEPAFTAWEAVVLPIYESCVFN